MTKPLAEMTLDELDAEHASLTSEINFSAMAQSTDVPYSQQAIFVMRRQAARARLHAVEAEIEKRVADAAFARSEAR